MSTQEVGALREAIRCIEEHLRQLPDRCNKSVIVIGDTGVGKSTLVNLLAGKELHTLYDDRRGRIYIDVPSPLHGMQVGHSVHSETLAPHQWVALDGTSYWDCPGFKDNHGEVQEIVNAVCMKKLFEISLQIKVILMINDHDVMELKATHLIPLSRELVELFSEQVEKMQKSLYLIVSRAPQDRKIDQIRASISGTLQGGIPLTPLQKTLLAALRDASISIFKIPPQGKNIFLRKEEVFDTLGQIPFVENLRISIGLSDRGREVALVSYNLLSKTIESEVIKWLIDFGKVLQSFALAASPKKLEGLQDIISQLNHLELALQHSEREKDLQKIFSAFARCGEIAHNCGKDLSIQDLQASILQLDAKQFLEEIVHPPAQAALKVLLLLQNKVREYKDLLVKTMLLEQERRRAEEARKAADAAKLEEEIALQTQDTSRMQELCSKLSSEINDLRKRHGRIQTQQGIQQWQAFINERKRRPFHLEGNATLQQADTQRLCQIVGAMKQTLEQQQQRHCHHHHQHHHHPTSEAKRQEALRIIRAEVEPFLDQRNARRYS